MDEYLEGEDWKPEVKRILRTWGMTFSFNKKNETIKKVTNKSDIQEAFDIKNRRLASKDFGNGTRISTVFLGIDHNMFGDSHTPILFETMAWYKNEDYECRRYPTAEAAMTGHNEILAALEIAVANNL